MAALAAGCSPGLTTPTTTQTPEVAVLHAKSQVLPLTRDLVGRVSSIRSADVRARVPGILLKRMYREGSEVTAGKSVEAGEGEFSPVGSIDELLGGYAEAQVHAGAVNSVQAQVMTKGEVSLALSGKGHGWSLGIDFGELKIER